MAGGRGRRGRRVGRPPSPAGSGASSWDLPWPRLARSPPSSPCAAARRPRVRPAPSAADGQEGAAAGEQRRRWLVHRAEEAEARGRGGRWRRRQKVDGVGSEQGRGQVGLDVRLGCVRWFGSTIREERVPAISIAGDDCVSRIHACADDCVVYPCMRIDNKTDER
jgi:hypothetical protein